MVPFHKILWFFRVFVQLFPVILFLCVVTIIPEELAGDALIGFFGLFLIIRGFFGKSTSKEISKIKNIPINNIADIKNGIVKIKGELKAIKRIKSELTKTKCIGYSYSEKIWIKKKSGSKYNAVSKKISHTQRDSKKLKTIRSEIVCENFYFIDNTGKVLVNANNIEMLTSYNNIREQKSGIFYSEDILLENKEYYLIGYFDQEHNQISSGKKFNQKEEFFVIDLKNYKMLNGGSKMYRIGCGFLLLVITVSFFGFISKDFWIYIYQQLK